jgi:outer membrane protein
MKIFCAAAVFLLLMPSILRAEDGKVTLKEAITLALKKNNLIKAAEFEKAAAKHGASASRSRYFPRIFLDESFTRSNSPTRVFMMKLDQGRFTQDDFLINNLNHPSPTSDFRTAFTLEQPLFDLGIYYGANIAGTEAEGKGLALERRREDVGFMVFASYLEVQQAGAALEAAEKAVGDAREHARLAKVRTEAGTGLKSDELRALTFLAEMEQQEITAKNNVLLAEMRLALATGGKPGDVLGIREVVEGMSPGMKEEEILPVALKNRKDLQELKKETEKANLDVKLAGSAFWPTVYGSATYQMHDPTTPFSRENDAWTVGANLRWELFDGMRRLEDRSRSVALRNSAREYLDQRTREIALQVKESQLRRDEAEKKLEVARASYLQAEEGVRLISRRFANSLATMVEVLDAQTALNRTRVDIVDNEAGYALATARVWYAAGVFLKEVMK